MNFSGGETRKEQEEDRSCKAAYPVQPAIRHGCSDLWPSSWSQRQPEHISIYDL